MFDNETLVESLMASGLGIENYIEIMKSVKNIDVSGDEKFQKKFNHFYRVRRNIEWRTKYYDFFERSKNNHNISFEEIVRCLYEETGNVEASFASKMLATINPNMPIWDQYVLARLELKFKGNNPEVKINNAIDVYNCIINKYEESLNTREVKENLQLFDKLLPRYTEISAVKKLDFLIWGTKGTERDKDND